MQEYSCKKCGAELYWNAETQKLKCNYCNEEFDPINFTDNTKTKQKSEDYDNRYTLEGEKVHQSLLVYKCSYCGAEIITSKKTVATTCTYCNRAISITDKSLKDFRPETIIPFSITKEQAIENYKKYIKKSFLIPKSFLDEQKINYIQGIYVPYYLHSAEVESKSLIKGEIEKSYRRGNDKVEIYKIFHIDIKAKNKLHNLPTDASDKLDNRLMDALEPFDYTYMYDYNPSFMAGYFAEQKDESGNLTSIRAEERISDYMKEQASQAAGKYTCKTFLEHKDDFKNLTSIYTMLPVWILNIEYNDEMHTFAINGQTGKVVGILPKNNIKLGLITAGTYLITAGTLTCLYNLISKLMP